MEPRDLGTLDLTTYLYVTLGKPLHFDHPLCYNDKVRPFSFLYFFSSSLRGRARQLLKEFQNLVTWHNENLVRTHTNIHMWFLHQVAQLQGGPLRFMCPSTSHLEVLPLHRTLLYIVSNLSSLAQISTEGKIKLVHGRVGRNHCEVVWKCILALSVSPSISIFIKNQKTLERWYWHISNFSCLAWNSNPVSNETYSKAW